MKPVSGSGNASSCKQNLATSSDYGVYATTCKLCSERNVEQTMLTNFQKDGQPTETN